MSISSANIANILKKVYTDASMAHFMLCQNPLLGLIEKKMTSGSDGGTVIPAIYGDYAGRSADFTESLSSMASGYIPNEAFNLTIAENFANAQIGHRQIKATQNNATAFLNMLKEAQESNMRSLRKDLAFDLFRDGSGIIGTVSTVAGQVITFTDRKGMRKIDLGTRLFCYSDSAFGTQRANTAVVTHIDRAGGKVTVTGTITAWAAADVVTVAGDAGIKIKGIASWIPSTAPTSGDNFFGVDRSKDAVALAGVRFDAGSMMLKDAFIDASAELVEISEANPDVIVVSPRKFAELAKETSDRSTTVGFNGKIEIGYSSIKIACANGLVDVVVDASVPDNRAYMLDLATWKFLCLGSSKLFSTWSEDGLDMIRSASANSLEMRMYSYIQLACFAPSKNAVILFNS